MSEADARRVALADEIEWAMRQATEAAMVAATDPALRRLVKDDLRAAATAILRTLAQDGGMARSDAQPVPVLAGCGT